MVRKLPPDTFYSIRDPNNFYRAMRDDVAFLHKHRKYLSLTTVLVCCLDALGAVSGEATRGKFASFVTQHFPQLCEAFEKCCPGKTGAATLYENFRNGFAHLRIPKGKFAIVEDHEVDGLWVDLFEIDGQGQFVGLNVDRLAR